MTAGQAQQDRRHAHGRGTGPYPPEDRQGRLCRARDGRMAWRVTISRAVLAALVGGPAVINAAGVYAQLVAAR
jgi:hypothetical protein